MDFEWESLSHRRMYLRNLVNRALSLYNLPLLLLLFWTSCDDSFLRVICDDCEMIHDLYVCAVCVYLCGDCYDYDGGDYRNDCDVSGCYYDGRHA